MTTRRQLVAAGVGALAASLARPPRAAAAGGQSAVLRTLIAIEDAAAAAYAIAAGTTGDALLARIAAHDDLHGRALRVQLESLTVIPPHHAAGAERAEPAAIVLAEAGTRREALDAAIALEDHVQEAYAAAAATLVAPGVLQTVATVLGAHAQQLAALRQAAGRPPLDEAFVSAT